MPLNTMVWLNFSLNPSQAKKWHFFTFFPEKNDFFTQFDMYFRLGLKIGVFDAFKYDGVGAIKLKPFPSEKKMYFLPFFAKKWKFSKKWYGYQNMGFWCRWIRWCGWIFVETPHKWKNSNFLHFFEIKINYAKMSKYVLIWVLKYSYLMPLNTVVCVHFS